MTIYAFITTVSIIVALVFGLIIAVDEEIPPRRTLILTFVGLIAILLWPLVLVVGLTVALPVYLFGVWKTDSWMPFDRS